MASSTQPPCRKILKTKQWNTSFCAGHPRKRRSYDLDRLRQELQQLRQDQQRTDSLITQPPPRKSPRLQPRSAAAFDLDRLGQLLRRGPQEQQQQAQQRPTAPTPTRPPRTSVNLQKLKVLLRRDRRHHAYQVQREEQHRPSPRPQPVELQAVRLPQPAAAPAPRRRSSEQVRAAPYRVQDRPPRAAEVGGQAGGRVQEDPYASKITFSYISYRFYTSSIFLTQNQ